MDDGIVDPGAARATPADAATGAHPRPMPPGYPREYERVVSLSDGRHVVIRPVVPADAAQLEQAFRTADAQTLRSRFLGTPPHVSSKLLAYLTGVDYVRRFALVAGDPGTGRGVGVARYESCGEATAEVAVVVDPAWRRVGLATAMVELLAEAAIDRGIDTFVATYIADNRPVTALLDLVGNLDRRQISQGIAEIAVHLDRIRVAAAIRALDTETPTT